jgi:hypothetical protein
MEKMIEVIYLYDGWVKIRQSAWTEIIKDLEKVSTVKENDHTWEDYEGRVLEWCQKVDYKVNIQKNVSVEEALKEVPIEMQAAVLGMYSRWHSIGRK